VAAAFSRASFVEIVEKKILERFKEQRPKPAAAWIRAFEEVSFKHHEKKVLGQVLRVGDGPSLPADESEHWTPIDFAKFRERFADRIFSEGGIGAGEDNAPAGGGEPLGGVAARGGGVRLHSRGC